MESSIEKKQRIEHRDEGMEEMPTINYNQPCEIDEDYIKHVIQGLESDIKSFKGPGYDSNPHIIGVRIALQAMVGALQAGLYK